MKYDLTEKKVSVSKLRSLAKGPEIFHRRYVLGIRDDDDETENMIFGRAAHAYVLEGAEAFDRDYVIGPGNDKRLAAWKNFVKQMSAGEPPHDGRTVLRKRDGDAVREMRRLFIEDRFFGRLLRVKDGAAEEWFEYHDSDTGLNYNGRIDWMSQQARVIIDLKIYDGEWALDAIQRNLAVHLMYLQPAVYLRAMQTIHGGDDWAFVFAFMEKEAPHRVLPIQLDERALSFAQTQFLRWSFDLKRRCESDDWTGPGSGEVNTVGLPDWYLRRFN